MEYFQERQTIKNVLIFKIIIMKKIFASIIILATLSVNAQQYVSSGMIEYEVRINNHRMFGDGFFAEMFKDKMPNFSTTYYKLTFNDNRSIYKFDRLNEKDKMPWGTNNA